MPNYPGGLTARFVPSQTIREFLASPAPEGEHIPPPLRALARKGWAMLSGIVDLHVPGAVGLIEEGRLGRLQVRWVSLSEARASLGRLPAPHVRSMLDTVQHDGLVAILVTRRRGVCGIGMITGLLMTSEVARG